MAGASKALETLKTKPANWTVYEFDEIGVIDFLRGLDFFVHYTHSQYYEEFGRNIMEAMAVGIPVILPQSFEFIYGDAATYAPADAVSAVISNMWQDEALYKRKAKAGRDFVERHCSLRAFLPRYINALEKGRLVT